MTLQEIHENWKTRTNDEKSLYIEYVCFCNFSDDEDFYYYLHPEEASEAQFLSVLDFLYHEDCYVMLNRYLRDNRERLIYPEFDTLEGMELKENIEERFSQLCF